MADIKRIVTSDVPGRNISDPYERSYVIAENGRIDYHYGNGEMLPVSAPGVVYGAGHDSGDGFGYNTIKLIPHSPEGDINDDRYLIIDPTTPNHIHIRAGGQQDASGAELFLGAEETHIRVSDSSDNIVIKSSSGQYLQYSSPEQQIATVGDVSNAVNAEMSFIVQGGTLGTQPTFNGDPLFSGSYVKVGSMVHFQIQVDMDNITNFGSGQYYVVLPFSAKYGYQVREGCLHDISTGKQYSISGHVFPNSNQLLLSFTNSNGQDGAFDFNSPVTLDIEDNFHISGTYIIQDLL